MKKFLIVAVLMGSASLALAGPKDQQIGPATSISDVIISSQGAGKAVCLTHLSPSVFIYGVNVATLTVVDGLISGTTIYRVNLSTTGGLSTPTVMPDLLSDQDPLCGSVGQGLEIKINAQFDSLNYKGFVQKVYE